MATGEIRSRAVVIERGETAVAEIVHGRRLTHDACKPRFLNRLFKRKWASFEFLKDIKASVFLSLPYFFGIVAVPAVE